MRPDGYLLPRGITVDRIVSEVARGFGITVEEIVGPSRSPVIVTARACAMAVVRNTTDWSLSQIGRYFDRDNTTVVHHVSKVMGDPELRREVELVVEELSPHPSLFAVPADHQEVV